MVYVGDGTMWDYEGVDVTGKIVLIDIDQRSNWWITYPMLEAQYQGAAAILAANVGGFAQIDEDALNCQDICGPTAIPTLSIGLNDSQLIQASMANGPVTATLVVDNEVSEDGTTYNIMGRIPGRSSDYQIIVGGHYDVHFTGFQDDNCAVGLVLAMAKAMIDSGYQPENDIVFCLHGAEEWGSSYTQYDWTVGAWEMINNVHPEWVGKTLAFLNFELPAYEFSTYTSTYSAPEMYAMLDYFANEYPYSPDPEGCFPDGVLTDGYQTYTYVDEYAWTVNNVLEWYAMYFSPEVIAIQDDMLWGADNQDNLYWGTDIGFTKADVDAATRSLFVRYEEDGGDFSQEIAVYQAAIQAQTQILADLGAKETQAMLDLSALLG